MTNCSPSTIVAVSPAAKTQPLLYGAYIIVVDFNHSLSVRWAFISIVIETNSSSALTYNNENANSNIILTINIV